MPNLKNKSTLISEIGSRIPDNNAGSISAADIREPLVDLTHSINLIVSSGDHNEAFPFENNVRTKGFFITEQGITFPNSNEPDQTMPYPGPSGINHNDLANRDNIASHPGFLDLGGTRTMTGSIKMGGKYIASSGDLVSNRGLKFDYFPSGDKITLGQNTTFNFQDGSNFKSARGIAKAWINFDASEPSVIVNSYHNISKIERLDAGKFKLTIPSGVLKNEHCVCFGHSNSRSAAGSAEDFDRNHIGIVDRVSVSGTVVVSFQVLNEMSQYTDAEINDLVVFGYDVDEPANSGIVIVG